MCYFDNKILTRLYYDRKYFSKKKCIFTEKKAEIEKLAEEYVATVKNLASEQRVEHLQKIQNAYSKCKEFSDDKVQLAMQTYEMVSAEYSGFCFCFNSQMLVLYCQNRI